MLMSTEFLQMLISTFKAAGPSGTMFRAAGPSGTPPSSTICPPACAMCIETKYCHCSRHSLFITITIAIANIIVIATARSTAIHIATAIKMLVITLMIY